MDHPAGRHHPPAAFPPKDQPLWAALTSGGSLIDIRGGGDRMPIVSFSGGTAPRHPGQQRSLCGSARLRRSSTLEP